MLDQVRLNHILNRAGIFANAGGNVVHAHRAAVKAMNDGFEQLAVHHVKTFRINVEHRQRLRGDGLRDRAIGLHIGKVAHAAQQPVGDAGRTARAAGDFHRACGIYRGVEQTGAAGDDALQLLRRIKLQPRHDAEAVAQRVGQHPGTGGSTHQGEGLQIQLDGAGRRPFANHDVDLVVLQRGVEDFFHHGREAVNLVNEQHIPRLQPGEQGGQVLGLFQHRAAGLAQVYPQFGGNDVRQRRLAQAGRAKQQHMVQRLAALFGGTDKDFQLLARLGLADVFIQQLGAQGPLLRLLTARSTGGGNQARGGCGGGGRCGVAQAEIFGVDAHGFLNQ